MLALRLLPEARVQFRIRNDPHPRREGDPVEPAAGEPDGGKEWMTSEKVEVEVEAVDQLG